MQTIKTGVVVTLLLAVCYGAFIALNAPEQEIPEELLSEFDWNPDEAGLGDLMNIEMPSSDPMASLDAITLPSKPGGDPITGLDPAGGFPEVGASNRTAAALPQSPPATRNPGAENSASIPHISQDTFPQATFPQASGSQTKGIQSTLDPASLPSFPGSPSIDSATFNGSDGPAVSLNGTPALPSASTSGEGPTLAAGQMISQTRKPAESPDVAMIPLLDKVPAAGGSQPLPTLPFATAREQAFEKASNGKLREALEQLSQYYDTPELNHAQHSDLVDILDALTREVIYSNRHLVQPAYVVAVGDTLESVAQKFEVTPELLAAINRMGDSRAIVPGAQIKVLQGPFRAQVSLNRGELTVFMGELYAGRFPISIGNDPTPTEGAFEVVDRRRDRTYYFSGGKVIPAHDPRNPYGGFWLNLGQDLCIHGTPEMASSDLEDAGCISLAPLDAADLYNILAEGSHVVIAH